MVISESGDQPMSGGPPLIVAKKTHSTLVGQRDSLSKASLASDAKWQVEGNAVRRDWRVSLEARLGRDRAISRARHDHDLVLKY